MTIPHTIPRRGRFKAPTTWSWRVLLGMTLLAIGSMVFGIWTIIEFSQSWSGGVPFAVVMALCVAGLALWMMRHTWLNRQVQIDVMGLGQGLLENGMLVSGRVRYRRGPVVAIDYQAPGIEPMTLEYTTTHPLAEEVWQRRTVPVLLDPQQPEDAFCPVCVDIEWFHGSPRETDQNKEPKQNKETDQNKDTVQNKETENRLDTRPETLELLPSPTVEFAEHTFRLTQKSHHIRRNLLVRALDRVEGLIVRRPPKVLLRIADEGLIQQTTGDLVPSFIMAWDEPFRVHLSARLIDEGRAELGVSIRPPAPDETPDDNQRTTLEFRVELPVESVSRHVALQFTAAPWMDAADFAVLWPILLGHLEIHGDANDDLLSAVTLHHMGVTATPMMEAQDG